MVKQWDKRAYPCFELETKSDAICNPLLTNQEFKETNLIVWFYSMEGFLGFEMILGGGGEVVY